MFTISLRTAVPSIGIWAYGLQVVKLPIEK